MEYRCVDLADYGVALVPPSSSEFGPLLADIQKRSANPIPGSPPRFPDFEDVAAPMMILCNRSQTGIAAVSWVWKFEPETGRTTSSSFSPIGSTPSLLVPFGLDDRLRKLYGYWHVILPGSKRAIRGNSMSGDNTDIRPPAPDELWKGGGLGGGSGSRRALAPLKSVTLSLDGVFFVDGGFAGPDTLRNFDRVKADVDAHLQVATIAREGHDRGLAPEAIFTKLQAVTGANLSPAPPGPPPMNRSGDFRDETLRRLAWQIAMMRHQGATDDQVIYRLTSWTGTPLPQFRKL